ncbi:glycosyltransferase family 4 protein [Tsuneonella troitsensis]|uniref:glycosyltransferase family 4 protein n=1 Tax=Tsuneonella troitsensis TaxID=292222 RepID=UPI00070E5A7A|nr:glycosyltransferase family 4 protein [Tsuneonella troitsensis]
MASDVASGRREPRIVFVTRKWPPAVGGMETWSYRLAQSLQAIEPVQTIALPGRNDGMPPSAWALLAFPFTVLVRLLARRAKPEVLHLGDMALWALALPILGGRTTRIVISAHGTDVSYPRRGGIKGRLYGAYLRLGARLLYRATVVANSHATAEIAAESGWRAAAVVPLATDMSGPAPTGQHDGTLLFAGRLLEHKGCGWFLREVMPLLPAEVSLRVAGTGWDAAERAALCGPRIEFLGALPQKPLAEAYGRALCVIMPNIVTPRGEVEGFGLVAPEAAAAGGVVLAADHGGLRDAVLDGETGFLVPSGDAQAWAAAVQRIAAWTDAQRTAFIERAQARARAHFSWARVAAQVHSLYEGAR